MQTLRSLPRRLLGRLVIALVAVLAFLRARSAFRRDGGSATRRRRDERTVLVSLYDVHPGAGAAPRRRMGLRSIPLERVVGTTRHPSQNTADFLPLPHLRGANWRGRWQRITRANDRLATLPPIEAVQVGDDYYVVDGHNRVAAARLADGVEIDADVTQLLVPGVERHGQAMLDPSALYGTTEVRQAGQGRQSRTVEQPGAIDGVTRRQLADDQERRR
jgi:hypothetical protein